MGDRWHQRTYVREKWCYVGCPVCVRVCLYARLICPVARARAPSCGRCAQARSSHLVRDTNMDSFREYTLQLGAAFQEWRTFPRALRDDASRVAVGTFTFQHFPISAFTLFSTFSARARVVGLGAACCCCCFCCRRC